ncbi:MAG: hypothetical protein M1818_005536 [Claussenomyces sp. TS43310]|nr:MAG: hypothetical protein M1818_005536 [Claussenomyces sp. TS43310]
MAAFVALRFSTGNLDFIKTRLGEQWYQLSMKGRQTLLSSWIDNVKCNFTGLGDDEDELTEYLVIVPNLTDNPDLRIEDGMMLITSEDIAEVFRPIIQDVKELVHTQVDKAQNLGNDVKVLGVRSFVECAEMLSVPAELAAIMVHQPIPSLILIYIQLHARGGVH